jgi:hypothetical protein
MDKKCSIDYILNKLLEVEKMKFILFSETELLALKLMNIPSFAVLKKKISKDDILQNMWSKYELYIDINEKDLIYLEKELIKSNLTSNESKILSFI